MTNKEILNKIINKAGNNFLPPRNHAEQIQLIFNHRFAKAFWGDGDKEIYPRQSKGLLRWQYYLQQMVLEEEPLKYLEKFL